MLVILLFLISFFSILISVSLDEYVLTLLTQSTLVLFLIINDQATTNDQILDRFGSFYASQFVNERCQDYLLSLQNRGASKASDN